METVILEDTLNKRWKDGENLFVDRILLTKISC